MAGRIEQPITIEAAVRNIVERNYLLPSIQRNFTWDMDQVCRLVRLADAALPDQQPDAVAGRVRRGSRGLPLLRVPRPVTSSGSPRTTRTSTPRATAQFNAVMDGQQRLTSLYLGLKGTYAVKKHRAVVAEGVRPLSACRRASSTSTSPHRSTRNRNDGQLLLRLPVPHAGRPREAGGGRRQPLVRGREHPEVPEGRDRRRDLRARPRVPRGHRARAATGLPAGHSNASTKPSAARRTSHYYVEESQEIDRVLDIFIRTNQGGTPLSFSDLLMSITSANWEDARERVDELVNLIRNEFQFSIDRNFVMKAAVMVTGADVRFQVRNFDATNVAKIRETLGRHPAMQSLRRSALSDTSASTTHPCARRTPSCPSSTTCSTRTGRSRTGCVGRFDDNQQADQRTAKIAQGSGSGCSMSLAAWRVRTCRRPAAAEPPLASSATTWTSTEGSRWSRSWRRTAAPPVTSRFDSRVHRAASTEPRRMTPPATRSSRCCSLTWTSRRCCTSTICTRQPHSRLPLSIRREGLEDPELRSFFQDRENWNAIVNLHLLTESENTSKQDKPLKAWLASIGATTLDPMIPAGTDLEFLAFRDFVKARAQVIQQRLVNQVGSEFVHASEHVDLLEEALDE